MLVKINVSFICLPFLSIKITVCIGNSFNKPLSFKYLSTDIVNNVINEDVKESDTSPDMDDEKKKLEYQTETLELEILPTLIEEITTPTLESQDSKEEPENLYWEVDDVNPNQVIYDIENNKVITPISEEEITVIPEPVRKVISRNVSSRRRNFR